MLRLVILLILCSCTTVNKTKIIEEIKINISNRQIEVVAPSSACDVNFIDDYNVKFKGIAVSDSAKTQQLEHALLDSDNKIVWALRGGYGAANIVELLYQNHEFIRLIKQRERYPQFVGFSDVTALHLFLSQEFGWKTIHGPVFKEISNNQNIPYLIQVLDDRIRKIKFIGLKPLNDLAKNTIEVKGKLTGGNISIIQTSIGTKWQIDTKDKIIFLEDWQEKPYRLLRMLNHLRMANIFEEAKAIVIGDLCDTSNNTEKNLIDFAKNIQIPIYSLNLFGHGIYNYPMIYNAEITINLNNSIISLTQTF